MDERPELLPESEYLKEVQHGIRNISQVCQEARGRFDRDRGDYDSGRSRRQLSVGVRLGRGRGRVIEQLLVQPVGNVIFIALGE